MQISVRVVCYFCYCYKKHRQKQKQNHGDEGTGFPHSAICYKKQLPLSKKKNF